MNELPVGPPPRVYICSLMPIARVTPAILTACGQTFCCSFAKKSMLCAVLDWCAIRFPHIGFYTWRDKPIILERRANTLIDLVGYEIYVAAFPGTGFTQYDNTTVVAPMSRDQTLHRVGLIKINVLEWVWQNGEVFLADRL